jgi:hypothetical protein
MIKIAFKHAIYDYAIDVIFEKINSNFIPKDYIGIKGTEITNDHIGCVIKDFRTNDRDLHDYIRFQHQFQSMLIEIDENEKLPAYTVIVQGVNSKFVVIAVYINDEKMVYHIEKEVIVIYF